eukprot:COSAG01_NODE_26233_length_720_cov_1.247987_1_plen_204_part_01
MHVEWRATPRKKGQSWSVFVYREGAEGREQPLSVVQHSAGGLQGVVGHQAVGLQAAVARTRPPTTAAGFDPGVIMLDATSWCVDHHERTQQRAQTQAVHAAVVVAPGSASAGQRPMLVQASVVEAGGLSPSPAPEVWSQQWADVTPSSTARIFAQSRAALPAGTPLKPELTQVVHLDKHEGGAMDRRWLRIRAPVAAVSAGSDA